MFQDMVRKESKRFSKSHPLHLSYNWRCRGNYSPTWLLALYLYIFTGAQHDLNLGTESLWDLVEVHHSTVWLWIINVPGKHHRALGLSATWPQTLNWSSLT